MHSGRGGRLPGALNKAGHKAGGNSKLKSLQHKEKELQDTLSQSTLSFGNGILGIAPPLTLPLPSNQTSSELSEGITPLPEAHNAGHARSDADPHSPLKSTHANENADEEEGGEGGGCDSADEDDVDGADAEGPTDENEDEYPDRDTVGHDEVGQDDEPTLEGAVERVRIIYIYLCFILLLFFPPQYLCLVSFCWFLFCVNNLIPYTLVHPN